MIPRQTTTQPTIPHPEGAGVYRYYESGYLAGYRTGRNNRYNEYLAFSWCGAGRITTWRQDYTYQDAPAYYRTEHTYDEEGRMLSGQSFLDTVTETIVGSRMECRYDEAGRPIETRLFYGETVSDRNVYSYNEQGLLTTLERADEHEPWDGDPGSLDCYTEASYSYNAYGRATALTLHVYNGETGEWGNVAFDYTYE